MAMDDPWGSPWADERQHSVEPQADASAAKPTTPVRATSLALEQKTSSPWDDGDDDGFGDWAGASAEESNALGPGAADGGWGSDTGLDQGSELNPTNNALIPWEDLAVTPREDIPKLLASPFIKSDTLQHPSPDPWATEIRGEDNRSTDAAHVPAEEHDGEIFRPGQTVQLDIEIPTPIFADSEVASGELLPVSAAGRGLEEDGNNIVKSTNGDEDSTETSTTTEGSEQIGNAQEAEPEVSSRPSSSPSEHSHHDDAAQDSPRTSLDEEPKRPWVQRKVSTKVQEIVEKFEGLTQQEVAEPAVQKPPSTERTHEEEGDITEEELVEGEEADDFGDFEDVQSDAGEPMDEDRTESSPNPHGIEEASSTTTKRVTENDTPRALAHRKDLGPVEFSIDTSAFDRLYSGSEAQVLSDPEQVFISDIIPHDSFSSTEERKTWYRISRYGTMRKYNSGDDENYVRVNWVQSQVRTETLEIVARWIEEDRISGRVVLGGASKGSSIFGWGDAKAAPVTLAHAFAAKNGKQKAPPPATEPVVEVPREWPQGLVRSRSTSRTPSLSKVRRKSSIKASVSGESKPVTQGPIANFSWNDASPNGPRLKAQSTEVKKPAPQPSLVSSSSRLATKPIKTTRPTTEVPGRPISHTSILAPPAIKTSNLPEENDDDDWGELISSPTTNTVPVASSPMGPGHRATGSLGSAVPSKSPLSRLTSEHAHPLRPIQPSPQSVGSDRIMQPQSTSSMATNTTDMFIQNSFETSNNGYLTSTLSPAAVNNPSASTGDPWASADFSFFETSAARSSKVPPPSPQPKPPRSFGFSTAAVISSPQRSQKSREEIEHDKIVHSVIKGLPDLSYMLRR